MGRLIPLFFLLLLCTACNSRQGLVSSANRQDVRPRTAVAFKKEKADEKTERRFYEIYTEALRHKEAERIAAACELLEEALRLKPASPEALYELGILKLSYTTYSDSLSKTEGDSLLHRAVREAPDNLTYKETLARLYANRSRLREAIYLYEEIAEARPAVETLAFLEWLYKNNGDYPGAIRVLERIETLEGKNEELSLEMFNTYIAMKDTERAYRTMEELCAEYPDDLRYRVLLGDLYDRNGYHERALAIYKDVLTAEPDNSYAQMSLLAYYKAAGADSLYFDLLTRVVLNPRTQSGARLEAMRTYAVDNIKQGGDTARVMDLFRRAIAPQQTDANMVELMAFYMVERGMPQAQVTEVLKRILLIEPDDLQARLMLLQAYLRENRVKEVEEICREGILYDPTKLVYYYYHGTALYMLGRNHEAIAALQRGTERITPEDDREAASDVWALLGDVLHEEKLTEEAFAAYDNALRLNDRNILCLNNYAYFLSLKGERLSEAEKMSRKTIDAEADNATYLDTYAWILFRQKQYTQARIYINEALRHATEDASKASLYDHSGDILFYCGERKEAVEQWRKALALTTDQTEKAKLKRKISRRRP